MGYAGAKRILTYLSWVLSVMSALLALVPFWDCPCLIRQSVCEIGFRCGTRSVDNPPQFSALIVNDAINRIDEVLDEKPLPESGANNTPKDNGVVLEHVSYSYDGEKNALNDVSLKIRPGQVVALVGASGGGKTTLANMVFPFERTDKACCTRTSLSGSANAVASSRIRIGAFLRMAKRYLYTYVEELFRSGSMASFFGRHQENLE